jgi:hypothetical protein
MNNKEKVIEKYKYELVDRYDEYLTHIKNLNDDILRYKERMENEYDEIIIDYELYGYPDFCHAFIYQLNKADFTHITAHTITNILNNMLLDRIVVTYKKFV